MRGAVPHGHGFYCSEFGNFQVRKYGPETAAVLSPCLVCRPLAAASKTHYTTYSSNWEGLLLGIINEGSYAMVAIGGTPGGRWVVALILKHYSLYKFPYHEKKYNQFK